MIFMFRRRTFFTIILLCMLLVAASCLVIVNSQVLTTPTISWQMAEHTFIVDPGHGGTFPGRVNAEVLEKDINLAISLYLHQYLQESGAVAILTRDSDVDLIPEESKKESLKTQQRDDLQERVNLATTENSDYFISIHCNSIPNEKWFGAQCFYNPDDTESEQLAKAIQNRLTQQLDNSSREALPRVDTFLFRNSTVPTVIVECGFLSNPAEATKLQDTAYQKEIAYAIFLGISDYLSTT
ncbi:MAG: N-acetylmuramoyl-L-alanine amidase [Peptococcaceae bacterium]|nr:N-acetylmuramoyl-L-alanine amidase [Peptococcaceae bacterium]